MRPDLGCGTGATAVGRGEEAELIHAALGLVGVDRSDQQGDVGVAFDGDLALRGEAVDERVVDPSVADLGAVEHVEQESLVRAAAVDHDGRLVEGAPQADPCLVA